MLIKKEFEKLTNAVLKHVKTEGVNETLIPQIRIFKSTCKNVLTHTIYDSSILIILQGSKKVKIGNLTLVYDEKSYLISSLNLPMEGEILKASNEKPFLSLLISFNLDDMYSILKKRYENYKNVDTCIKTFSVDEEMFEITKRVVKLLEKEEFEANYIAPLLIKELIFKISKNSSIFQFFTKNSNARKIQKTINFINDNLNEKININDLAQSVSLSPASYFKYFKIMTNLTPIQYQKTKRLHLAHEMIKNDEKTIGDIAFSLGYESQSQFSREYKRLFGNSAKFTLRN
ncbi:MAG: AraC family transcriptional regulator [Campylobacteraceae bacterium]